MSFVNSSSRAGMEYITCACTVIKDENAYTITEGGDKVASVTGSDTGIVTVVLKDTYVALRFASCQPVQGTAGTLIEAVILPVSDTVSSTKNIVFQILTMADGTVVQDDNLDGMTLKFFFALQSKDL